MSGLEVVVVVVVIVVWLGLVALAVLGGLALARHRRAYRAPRRDDEARP